MVMIKGAFFTAVLALATYSSARPVWHEPTIVQRDINDLGVRHIAAEPVVLQRSPDVNVIGVRSIPNQGQSYQMINKREISPEIAVKTDKNGNIVLYDPSQVSKREVIAAEIPTMTDKFGNIIPYGASKRDLSGSEEAVTAPDGVVGLYARFTQDQSNAIAVGLSELAQQIADNAGAGEVTGLKRAVPEEVPSKSGPGGAVEAY